MRLSAKSRFAVAAMIDLALRDDSGPVPLNSIGQRLQISLSYLEQLFSKLRQHGLVESTRGPGGGYTLARPAQSISVADIIRAVEGPRGLQTDESAEGDEGGLGLTAELWSGLNSRMMEYLQGIRLQQLCSEQRAKMSPHALLSTPARAQRRGIFSKGHAPMPRTTAPNSVFALATAAIVKR